MAGIEEAIVAIMGTKEVVADTEEDMVGTEVAMVGTKEGMVVAIVGTNVFRVTIRLLFPRNQTYQTIIDSWSCQNGVVWRGNEWVCRSAVEYQ